MIRKTDYLRQAYAAVCRAMKASCAHEPRPRAEADATMAAEAFLRAVCLDPAPGSPVALALMCLKRSQGALDQPTARMALIDALEWINLEMTK